jgi:hypothetical protein
MLILLTLTLVRMLLPLTVLRWPLIGVLLTLGADLVDYHIFQMMYPIDFTLYSRWDKMLDFYYLIFFWFATWEWKNMTARYLGSALFAYRSLGVVLFLASGTTGFLFFFPNLFENFFILYLLSLKLLNKDMIKNFKFASIFITIASVPKLAQEYVMHFARLEFWKWFEW